MAFVTAFEPQAAGAWHLAGAMEQLQDSLITYRVAVGP
jgi:hypothetical protein